MGKYQETSRRLAVAMKEAARLKRLSLAADRDVMELQNTLRRSVPDEPPGRFITFSLRMNGTVYDFVAIKVSAMSGRWFTSGSTCPKHGWQWDELWAYMQSADDIPTMPTVLTTF